MLSGDMEFEWDENKRLANLAKHGIDFVDAAAMWKQPVIDSYARRAHAGEMRITALGAYGPDEMIIAIVYTFRRDRLRLISARRASRHERQDFINEFGRGR
jgi:uncharacterized DUF497 family protein